MWFYYVRKEGLRKIYCLLYTERGSNFLLWLPRQETKKKKEKHKLDAFQFHCSQNLARWFKHGGILDFCSSGFPTFSSFDLAKYRDVISSAVPLQQFSVCTYSSVKMFFILQTYNDKWLSLCSLPVFKQITCKQSAQQMVRQVNISVNLWKMQSEEMVTGWLLRQMWSTDFSIKILVCSNFTYF